MKTKQLLLSLFISMFYFCLLAQPTISVFSSEGVVNSSGFNSSNSYCCNPNADLPSAITTYNDYQFVIYYKLNTEGSSKVRRLVLARRNLALATPVWKEIIFPDFIYTTTDTHANAAIGISSSNGRIHLAYDCHDSPLKYRISLAAAANLTDANWTLENAFDITSLSEGKERSYLNAGTPIPSMTYPAFIPTPAGNLLFSYRVGGSGSGDWYMRRYTGTYWSVDNGYYIWQKGGIYAASVGNPPGDDGQRRCAYPSFAYSGTNGTNDRLHAVFTWRENADGIRSNHDLMYVYSEDEGLTWRNVFDDLVATVGTTAIDISSNTRIKSIPLDSKLSNNLFVAANYNSTTNSHAVYVNAEHSDTVGGSVMHYIYKLDVSTNWPKIIAPEQGNLLLSSSGELIEVYTNNTFTNGYKFLNVDKLSATKVNTSSNWKKAAPYINPGWISHYSDNGVNSKAIDQPAVDLGRWKSKGIISIYATGRSPYSPTNLPPPNTVIPQKVISMHPINISNQVKRSFNATSIKSDDSNIVVGTITIYPNPASKEVFISNLKQTNVVCEIFGLNGAAVQSTLVTSTNSVDVRNLTKGVYLLQLISESVIIHTQKIVIM